MISIELFIYNYSFSCMCYSMIYTYIHLLCAYEIYHQFEQKFRVSQQKDFLKFYIFYFYNAYVQEEHIVYSEYD